MTAFRRVELFTRTQKSANMAAANMSTDASADLNTENVIAKVLEKQQNVLESVVAVKEALAEIDTSVQHIRTELERQGATIRYRYQFFGPHMHSPVC